jgi:glycosyltransferase involved in cell wall biosynthesis
MSKNNSSVLDKSDIISIGLPVYNGENFIQKAITSILSQTFPNFELIVSDNASTDSTQKICKEFEKKDKRIRFFRQEKNFGYIQNFKFVLDKAHYNYFVWLSADDYWEPTFLEKNLKFLKGNFSVVGSISKIGIFDQSNTNDSNLKNMNRTSRRHLNSYAIYNIKGTYEEKVRFCLKHPSVTQAMYSVFRTKYLRKCDVWSTRVWDKALILNIVKFGDIHCMDEILMYRYTKGYSTPNIINQYFKHKLITLREMFFPYGDFTGWSLKYLGTKLIIKNLDTYLWLSCAGPIAILLAIKRLVRE